MRINITILFFCLFSWCQPAFAQKITFALLTDLHVNPNSPSDTALHHMVDEINSSQLDFVVVSGDLTNTGSNAELDAVKNSLSALHIPCYVIPGNHETNWSESAGMHFLKLFGNDRFLIRKNGFLLVGFNTGPFMKMGDGIVKQEDLRWLNQELAKTKTNNETLIAFSHYPLAEGLSNWAQVTEILKKNNCRLSFCGHGHHLALFNFDGIPGIMGRAMLMQNNQLAGYNIVELRDDSVFVSQKELGQKKELSLFHFNYLKSEGLDSLPKSQNSDIILNKQYPDIKVAFSLQDSASIFAGPCVANNKILIYCNSLGKVKAVELKSKKLIWQKELHKPIYSTPVCGNRVVILGTLAGEIIGIDIRNGNQLWKINVGTPVLAQGVIEDDQLYIGGGSTAFYKIDIKKGTIIWKFANISGSIQGKPAVDDHHIVFGAWDCHLYCLDKSSGKLLWKWDNGRSQKLYSPGNIVPAIANGKVFLVAPDRCMTALDLNSGEQIWRNCAHQVRESMGISSNCKEIYAKLMNDSVIAVSTLSAEFKINWGINAGFGYEHAPCPILSTKKEVIIGTRSGEIYAINRHSHRLNWRYKAGNSAINQLFWGKDRSVYATLCEGIVIKLKKKR